MLRAVMALPFKLPRCCLTVLVEAQRSLASVVGGWRGQTVRDVGKHDMTTTLN